MNKFLLTIVFAAVLNADTGKFGVEEDDNVAVLTDDNFDQFVKDHQFVFVKFYAPWCGHCKSMAPDYAKLAKKVHEEDSGVVIAKLDATVHKNVSSAQGVQGFPTLKFFVNGNAVDYQGAREYDALYNWIQKKTGPSSKLLSNDEELNTHSSSRLSVLYLLPEGNEDALKQYMNLASTYDDVSFAHTHSSDHSKKLELTDDFNMVVFRTFDDGKKTLSGSNAHTTEQMREFLEQHRFPIVSDFDQEAANRIFGGQMDAMFLLTDSDDSDAVTDFRNFAKENRGQKLVFSLSKISSGLGQRLAEYIGVKSSQDPAARIVTFKGGKLDKYVLEDVSSAGLKKGMEDFVGGKLTPHYKSAAVPETNDEPVKVIVGDNFDQMVTTDDKYVLLEAYAPWCGHCKKLDPIYKELAEKLAQESDVVIAKMDATENEHPLMPVTGFPTLRLFKPGNKTPVDYSGDRSLKDLVKFMETNTGRTFEGVKSEEL